MRPIDLATRETLRWLSDLLPAPPARILDVGCGQGYLAAQLLAQGFQVTALDKDPEAVRRAREAGVQSMEADFLDYEDEVYDVVVFSRSLHHIHPLSKAVARASALLKPGGLLFAEEFARERADRETAAWFFDMCSLLEASGVLSSGDALPSSPDPLQRWHALYASVDEHPLHEGAAMRATLQRYFEFTESTESAYLYQSLSQWLEESDRGFRVAEELLKIEGRRIAECSLVALGLSLVAR